MGESEVVVKAAVYSSGERAVFLAEFPVRVGGCEQGVADSVAVFGDGGLVDRAVGVGGGGVVQGEQRPGDLVGPAPRGGAGGGGVVVDDGLQFAE